MATAAEGTKHPSGADAALVRLEAWQGINPALPMTQDDTDPRGHASPPCLAQKTDPAVLDPQQTVDLARWRKSERAALPVAARLSAAAAIAAHLDALLAARFGNPPRKCGAGQAEFSGQDERGDFE